MARGKGRITERLWLECDTRPADLANFALPRQTDRKIRLFLVACCGLVAHKLSDRRSLQALEIAARYADGRASGEELARADEFADAAGKALDREAMEGGPEERREAAWAVGYTTHLLDQPRPDEGESDGWVSYYTGGSVTDEVFAHVAKAMADGPPVGPQLTALLRDVCGNPFRRRRVKPVWLTANVVALARGIYEAQAFDRLPILADALQDAGCDSGDILAHCRSPGPHVRGCWVVDLVLGKG